MKYQLYLGLNDKDTKLQKIDTIEAYKMVENILLNNEITGYTIYQARGVFKHENGAITQEKHSNYWDDFCWRRTSWWVDSNT